MNGGNNFSSFLYCTCRRIHSITPTTDLLVSIGNPSPVGSLSKRIQPLETGTIYNPKEDWI